MNFKDPYEDKSYSNHVYIVENIPVCETEHLFEEFFSEGCRCVNFCTLENGCACLKKYGKNYNIAGSHNVLSNYTLNENKYNSGLYECNSSCNCLNKFCGNRYIQFGPNKNLEVRECSKGKGLFAAEDIKKGTFICEYAGEIIPEIEAVGRFKHNKENKQMNYIFCLKEHYESNTITTFIDPSYLGNVGRYANHSCNPNCLLIPIRVENTVPKLCIFTKTNIEKNEEITFDYGETSEQNQDSTPCLCNQENCRKWLPYLPEICGKFQ